MRKHSINKRAGARKFNKGARKTHPKNLKIMRGGWRL